MFVDNEKLTFKIPVYVFIKENWVAKFIDRFESTIHVFIITHYYSFSVFNKDFETLPYNPRIPAAQSPLN